MSSPSTSSGSSTGSSGTDYSASGSDSTSSGLHGISRVDQDSIKQQFTATDLIGKDVYDNGGKKVGEVKDLVLGSAAGSHLAMAFANSGSSQDSRSSSSAGRSSTTGAGSGTSSTSSGGTYGATTGSGATGSSTGATGASGTGSTSRIAGTDRMAGSSSTTGSTLGSDVSSAFNSLSGMASEPAAIVSLGGFMGMGDNLVRVPLSQLNYDSSNERLTIALSESELSSLTDRSNTRNAAE